MMNPEQLAAAVTAPIDQLVTAVHRHEEEAHGGTPCVETRIATIKALADEFGFLVLSMGVTCKQLAKAMGCEVEET